MIEDAVAELVPVVGVRDACGAVGRARSTHYRHHRRSKAPARLERTPARPQLRALDEVERKELLRVLHSDEHVDGAPATVYAKLLDEGIYLVSVPTMYRLLRADGEVRERRRQAVHPARVKPELVATKANQCWSWDITKLPGPAKWTYYYLYVILDIYSRYVPGWMLATRELATLAERLLAETIAKQGVERDQLTIHADRGSSMASKPVALLLADLGVTKSHSRPHVSNDNPYSESQFKTMKYRPSSPSASAHRRTPGPSARRSSPGTTRTTATRASASTLPRMSTTDAQSSCASSVARCCPPSTPRTPSASCADHRCRLSSRARCGSTSRVRRQTRRERRLRT
jgi:putative transposase